MLSTQQCSPACEQLTLRKGAGAGWVQNYSVPVQSWGLHIRGPLGRSVVPFKPSPPEDVLSLDLKIPNSIPEMK